MDKTYHEMLDESDVDCGFSNDRSAVRPVVTMSSLGLPEKPPSLNAWIDGEIRKYRFRVSTGEFVVNADTAADIARGAALLGEMIALCHSELSEALEARRKGDKPDDKLPHRPGWRVELIDELIRVLDILGSEGQDEHPAGDIFVEKDGYNHVRLDHKPENRIKDGGKSF